MNINNDSSSSRAQEQGQQEAKEDRRPRISDVAPIIYPYTHTETRVHTDTHTPALSVQGEGKKGEKGALLSPISSAPSSSSSAGPSSAALELLSTLALTELGGRGKGGEQHKYTHTHTHGGGGGGGRGGGSGGGAEMDSGMGRREEKERRSRSYPPRESPLAKYVPKWVCVYVCVCVYVGACEGEGRSQREISGMAWSMCSFMY